MIYTAEGSPETVLKHQDLQRLLFEALDRIGPRKKVLAVPPDFTRLNSQAGPLTCMTHAYYQGALVDVMPALGTHVPMTDGQLERMYPTLPKSLIREHDWRKDVVTVGEVPADFVRDATGGIYDQAWPAQMNRLLWEGGHDLILSIGQVVPHEVIGMANYTKNIFVGTGGVQGINESHFIGAAYGMERMMGRADTPLRRILNEAADRFCSHLPILYVLTVVGADDSGDLVTRGLYIGDSHEVFEQAAGLSLKVNFTLLDEAPEKIVVYLDPEEFHSTWLGNKSIYRTRMAMADGGELIVLGPEVRTFGEDREIDRLIRKYGYRTTPEIMRAVNENEELRRNLSAAAHLIHGSSEGRFSVTYCPGRLTREEVEGVGYVWGDLGEMSRRYPVDQLKNGWNERNGERFYYISNPALGLWAQRERF